MARHDIRRPALVLVVGLMAAVIAFLGSGTIPLTSTPVALQADDGPSVVTDSQGRFYFDRLHRASHILRIDPQTLPAGVEPAAANLALTLSPGVSRWLAVAPGLALRATYHDDGTTLDGVLFRDHNDDGVQSVGELGVPGARVVDPDVYQYFVPFQNGNLIQSFNDVLNARCLNSPSTSPIIDSTISLTSISNGTTVYYDHWEDGYDADPIAPGPGSSTLILTLNAGVTGILGNDIATPYTLAYDGSDRITIVGQPIAAVRAAWLNDPGTRLAGAWEMERVSEWGQRYTVPIGEDIGQGNPNPALRSGDYDYVSVSVMAAYDNTVVQIDADADGVFERTQTINAGQTLFIRGTVDPAVVSVHSGAQISATLPIQAQMRTGNCRAAYSGRSYSLVPVERWSNDYWSPVSSFFSGANNCRVRYLQTQPNASADVDIYIVNPNAMPLTVNYENAGGAGVITVPTRSTASYLKLLTQQGALVRSNTRGVHLFASAPFWAVTAVDTTSLGNNGADFSWSYTLIPARDLSGLVALGWAPGNDGIPPAPNEYVSGSTVYVQAIANGTLVFADLDHNGTHDNFDTDGDGVLEVASAYGYNEQTSSAGILLNSGQMVRVSDPNDHDMTGAIIRSQDNVHPLAVVYGEDACIAGPQLPFLDFGYTVLPVPGAELGNSSRLLVDADRSGDISPGDTLEYRIQVFNNGVGPILAPVLLDTLPDTFTDFIVGSITSVPQPLGPGFSYDNGSGTFTYVPTAPLGTPDPQVHSIRAAYPDIFPGGSIVMTFRIILDRQIPSNVPAVVNKAQLTSSNIPPVSTTATSPINQVGVDAVELLIHKTDRRVTVKPLEPITYTLTYTNTGPGIAHNVIMTDTLPTTAFAVSSPTVPGVITPTIQPGRVIFQLGTLRPGQVGQTTISLKLSSLTTGAVTNTIVIGARSHEINPNNNRSVDIDQVPSRDLRFRIFMPFVATGR